jgi:zinc/manganese transport system substrate-binding protein
MTMMQRSRLLAVIFTLLVPTLALAALNVVTTSSSTGALIREITAEQVNLTILAPPDRDLHHLQARPSMIRALRGADLVVALGAELEVGWLPIAIQQAANPRILPGRIGYFEAAAQVTLLDVGGPANRALGDVHPMGNPHVNMDPVRMAQVGLALGERLAELDPSNAAIYRQRARAFQHQVDIQLPIWQQRTASAPGVIAFHRDSVYLLQRLAVPLLDTIELVPGIPPTAAHIQQLIHRLQGHQGIVLITSYQAEQAPQTLADALGWPLRRLPLEPPLEADGAGYLAHIDRWIAALTLAGN